MPLRRVRAGEAIALVGAGCVIAALLKTWYEGPATRLDAWDTFGPGVVLLLAAAALALVQVLSVVAERSVALSVALTVWTVPVAVAALVAAIVRVLERPDHATTVCAGAWLALAGAVAILAGTWQAMRDERTSLYERANPDARPGPR
jgi:uncharacterized membrane protein